MKIINSLSGNMNIVLIQLVVDVNIITAINLKQQKNFRTLYTISVHMYLTVVGY